MTTTQTAPTFPATGDLVIAEVFRYVSGVSSVPWAEPVASLIGTLEQVDADNYYIRDDNGQTVGRIGGVYQVEPDVMRGQARLFIRGWLSPGVWGCWIVTN